MRDHLIVAGIVLGWLALSLPLYALVFYLVWGRLPDL